MHGDARCILVLYGSCQMTDGSEVIHYNKLSLPYFAILHALLSNKQPLTAFALSLLFDSR